MVGVLLVERHKLQEDINLLNVTTERHLTEIDTAKHKHQDLIAIMAANDATAQTIREELNELKAKPPQVKYIIRTETKLVAGETTTVKEIPPDYTFRLKNNLAVAGIRNQGSSFDLETYDLRLKGTLTVTEKGSAVSVVGNSSYEPDQWVEVPVELTVTDTQKRNIFEPNVGLGLAIGYPWSIGGEVYTTFIHPIEDIDLAGVGIIFFEDDIQLSAILGAYNIGGPLPVLTNTWLGLQGTIDLQGNPGGSLFLGGKI